MNFQFQYPHLTERNRQALGRAARGQPSGEVQRDGALLVAGRQQVRVQEARECGQ